jgi:nitrate/TMAO reductase-like tetraheme cytochrome c subunit
MVACGFLTLKGNMTQPNPSDSRLPPSLRNWISLTGLLLSIAGLFAFLLLVALDYFAKDESPYLGILTYLVAPGLFVAGLSVIFVGFLLQRRQMARATPGTMPPVLTVDLSRPRDRRALFFFLCGSSVVLLITSVASYQTYHVTKTAIFCGQACHTVMEPQYVTYQNSPHAQVECTACHVGPGAISTVKAKFNGLHQVYSTLLNKVERPIDAHGKLKIDQRTCEQCHWPRRYAGNLDRTFNHVLDDTNNTPYSVRLLLKVGGADPTHGPVGGIHWHMNVANKVEYIATDILKQKIPWIRLTDIHGKVTEFRSSSFKDDPAKYAIQTMDCMDCHNRPAHHFRTPTDAVDLAISAGNISDKLPAIKRASVLALTANYKSRDEAMEKIASSLRAKFPNRGDVEATITEVQRIYNCYFFPEMKTDWQLYPNNIGHKDWPGCFRCHDNEHVSADGKKIDGSNCNSCHLIVAEGRGSDLEMLSSKGLKFKHPEEGWEDLRCFDCHNGRVD